MPENGTEYFSLNVTPFFQSSFFKISLVVVFITAFAWGMFIEINRILQFTVLGTYHYRNNLGVLTYSLTAVPPALLAGYLLQKGIRRGFWSEVEINVFYSSLFLALLLMLAGAEFLFFGEWGLAGPGIYLLVKYGLMLGFVFYLFRLWHLEQRQNASHQ